MGNASESLKADRREDISLFSSEEGSKSISEFDKEDFKTPLKHMGKIFTIIYDEKREVLWSGGKDKTICCWNISNGKCVQILKGHTEIVSCLTLDKSNGDLFSGSYGRNIFLWNLKKGLIEKSYGKNNNWITSIITHDGILYSGGYDCIITLYQIQSGKLIGTLKGHNMRIEDLVIREDGYLYSSSMDGSVRQWNLDTGKCDKMFSSEFEKSNIFQFRKKENNFHLDFLILNQNKKKKKKVLMFCKQGEFGLNCWDIHSNSQKNKIFNLKNNLEFPNFSAYKILFNQFILGWNIITKEFEIYDIKQENQNSTRSAPISVMTFKQDIVKTNLLIFCKEKNYLFYVVNDKIVKVQLKIKKIKKYLKKIKKNEKEEEEEEEEIENINEDIIKLTNYFINFSSYNKDDVTKIIQEQKEKISLQKKFDEKVKLIEEILIKNKNIQKKKKEIIEKKEEIKKIEPENKKVEPKIEVNLFEKKEQIIYEKDHLTFDLETKTETFYKKLYSKVSTSSVQPTVIVVRRENLVFDACKHFSLLSNEDFRKSMYIFFANEEGLDTGGVSREFYYLLAKQILNPNNALFLRNASNTYHPNPSSSVNKDHFQYFRFIGKLIGKAIYDIQMLDLPFSTIIFKLLCGKSINFQDLKFVEPVIYSSLQKIKNMKNIEELQLNFTADINDFGKNNTQDLIKDGHKIIVNEKNKIKFCEEYAKWVLVESIRPQLEQLILGVYDVIPREFFTIFNEKELELILCGSKNFDLEQWKQNTIYEGFEEDSPGVIIFWDTIENKFNQFERSQLLQFITGTSCIPIEGFCALNPKFSICKLFNASSEYLPVARTCLNRIEIPTYDSNDQFYKKIKKAMKEGLTFGQI